MSGEGASVKGPGTDLGGQHDRDQIRHQRVRRAGREVRETRTGISARPWAHRRTFPGTFFGPNEQVFRRVFKARLPIKKLFGPNLALELCRGNSEAVVRAKVREVMPKRLAHEIARVLPVKGISGDVSDDID